MPRWLRVPRGSLSHSRRRQAGGRPSPASRVDAAAPACRGEIQRMKLCRVVIDIIVACRADHHESDDVVLVNGDQQDPIPLARKECSASRRRATSKWSSNSSGSTPVDRLRCRSVDFRYSPRDRDRLQVERSQPLSTELRPDTASHEWARPGDHPRPSRRREWSRADFSGAICDALRHSQDAKRQPQGRRGALDGRSRDRDSMRRRRSGKQHITIRTATKRATETSWPDVTAGSCPGSTTVAKAETACGLDPHDARSLCEPRRFSDQQRPRSPA